MRNAADCLTEIGTQRLEVALQSDGRKGAFGTVAYGRATTSDGRTYPTKVLFSASCPGSDSIRYGDRLIVHAQLRPADYLTADSDWNRGVTARLTVGSFESAEPQGGKAPVLAVRSRALDAFERLGEPTGDVLKAIVCGYRTDVDALDVARDFRICGLAHMVAVSGAHLVIVASLMSSVLKWARLPRSIEVAVVAGTIAGYLVLTGMPVPAMRATIMAILGMGSYFAQRRSSSMNALGIAIIALLITDPSSSLQASFALSALATMGIVCFARYLQTVVRILAPVLPETAAEVLALTFSANMMTLPLTCALFSQLPLVSPLANVAAAPLFPVVCGSGIVAGLASAFGLPLAGWLLAGADACTGALCSLVHLLSLVPHASIPATMSNGAALSLSAAGAAVLYCWWPRPTRRALLAALAVGGVVLVTAVAVVPPSADRIVMLDVGQGDAFLLESKGATLLIDTGNQDAKLLAALARQRISKLDAVVITHADDDHCGSLDVLRGTVPVGEVLVASDMLSCDEASCRMLVAEASKSAERVRGLSYGDTVQVGTMTAEVVWPHGFRNEGGNEDSVCMRVADDADGDGVADATALFTGDIDVDSLKQAIGEAGMDDVDILKVGHHGSKTSTDADIVQRLHPRIALIGVGAHNRYGHPNEEVVEMFEDTGTRVCRSDEQGDVSCELHRFGIRVRAQR